MLKYIGKRILLFIPTMIVITLIGFVIAVNAPGNPVERLTSASQSDGGIGSNSVSQAEQQNLWKKKLGLDLPVFYFSLSKYSYPDTLYKIYDKQERESLSRLLDEYGNWEKISEYYISLLNFQQKLSFFRIETTDTSLYNENAIAENLNNIKFEVLALKSCFKENVIRSKFTVIDNSINYSRSLKSLQSELKRIESNYAAVKTNAAVWKNYIPVFNFYGNNQYHRWLFGDNEFSKGVLRFDFGISYQNKKPVTQKISEKISWSLFFSLASVLISYLVSIPLGVIAAKKRGGKFDRVSSFILYALFSLPNFFVALLLMVFFASPDFLGWLPVEGVKPAEGYPDDASFLQKAWISLPYIILPLISYTYHSFAYLSRTMRVSVLEVINQDYIRTARAKGLSEKVVVWKHAFRNSLLPLITLFANVFPAVIGGSVIIETIFSIPGMGQEMFTSITGTDYPMIIAVLTISGILTLVGYLVSDVLYALADPRIKYS